MICFRTNHDGCWHLGDEAIDLRMRETITNEIICFATTEYPSIQVNRYIESDRIRLAFVPQRLIFAISLSRPVKHRFSRVSDQMDSPCDQRPSGTRAI